MTSPLTPAPQIYTERTDDVQLEPTQEGKLYSKATILGLKSYYLTVRHNYSLK